MQYTVLCQVILEPDARPCGFLRQDFACPHVAIDGCLSMRMKCDAMLLAEKRLATEACCAVRVKGAPVSGRARARLAAMDSAEP